MGDQSSVEVDAVVLDTVKISGVISGTWGEKTMLRGFKFFRSLSIGIILNSWDYLLYICNQTQKDSEPDTKGL